MNGTPKEKKTWIKMQRDRKKLGSIEEKENG
jgi:hypothetical protein